MKIARLLLALTVSAAFSAVPTVYAADAPATEDEKIVYSLGWMVGTEYKQFGFTEKEIRMFEQGFADHASGGKMKVEIKEIGPKIRPFVQARLEAASKKQRKAGDDYFNKAQKEDGMTKNKDGFLIKTVKAGTGPKPKETDFVKVHYKGTLIDGKVFDSSYERGTPAEFPLDKVITCWKLGVQQMNVGGKYSLVCPPETAYGDVGSPPAIPGGSTLVFEVELLEIMKDNPEAGPDSAGKDGKK